jgi:hypothetical protein
VHFEIGKLQLAIARLRDLSRSARANSSDESQQTYQRKSDDALEWLRKQGDDASELNTRFDPYLMRQVEFPWWWLRSKAVWGKAERAKKN